MKSSSIVTKSLACVLALMLVIGNFTGIMPAGRAEGVTESSSNATAIQYACGFYAPMAGLQKSGSKGGFIPNREVPYKPGQISRGAHLAQDYISALGQWDVMAIYSGTVLSTNNALSSPAGRYVILSHNIGGITVYSIYQHLASIYVRQGEVVSGGHVIGRAGQSGVSENQYYQHLHLAIYSGIQDAWAPIQSNHPLNIEYSAPLTVYGTTYYPPDMVLNGSIVIGNGDYLKKPTSFNFSSVTYPRNYVLSAYGWSLTSGLLQSNVQLQSIRSQILTSSGNAVSDSGTKAISGYYYPVVSLDDFSGTDNGVRFSFIKNPGQYTWRLIATDISGRSITLDMPITAVASGSTSTATASKSYSADASISSVKLNKSSLTLESGKSATLTATVSPSKATNKSVTWSSSNTAVATVSNGVVKAVSAGTATITCTSVANNSKKATCTVTVNPAASEITGWVYKVNSSLTMRKDASTFSGRVTSIKKGTTITVTRKAKSLAYTWGYCSLNGKSGWVVVDNRWTTLQKMLTTKVAGVSLNNTYLSLKPGSSETLYANVSPSDAPNRNVTWSSSNTSVATVSNGVVKAVGAGTATITCTSAADSSKKATCTVTVSSSASTGDNTAKWVYRVQTSYGLNMRSGAGTGYGIVTTLYSPTTITVTRKATANGYTWGYGTSSTGYTGWIVIDNSWSSLVG